MSGTNTVLWVLWATYGSFYFCRTNISAALPGIESEFGFTKAEMGGVLAGLKIAYAIGQFVNGQLAERLSPKRMLMVGLCLSAALNVVFGFGAAVWFFAFIWAMNGYAQSLGWTPTMRVAANWIPPVVRGRSIGVIGTGYMVAASLSYLVSGAAAEYGWRYALWVPSLILFGSCFHMMVLLRESPGEPTGGVREGVGIAPRERRPFRQVLRDTLTNPDLWLIALALGLLNACRYGFLDWGVTLIVDEQGDKVWKAASKFAILPAGGILGAYGAGWLTDRVFGGRRSPVIFGLLVALAALTIIFKYAVASGTLATVVCLFCVGVTIYGPQVLLVGTAPADLARGGTVAAAVGFVNFMGYIGAAGGDVITGVMAADDWENVYYLWSSWVLIAAALVAVLWKKTAAGSDSTS